MENTNIKDENINDPIKDFNALISENKFVIVHVSAAWCGPCRKIESNVKQLVENMDPRIKYVKLDLDEDEELGDHLDIEKIPTFINYIHSNKTNTHVGSDLENIRILFEKTEAHCLFN